MKSHQTAGKISWSLLHDLMLLERDLPGWLGDCELFPPIGGSTKDQLIRIIWIDVDWYPLRCQNCWINWWLSTYMMIQYDDGLVDHHLKRKDTHGGSTCYVIHYYIGFYEYSCLNVLCSPSEKCLYIYIYILYIFETWNHQADDCNTWPSNINFALSHHGLMHDFGSVRHFRPHTCWPTRKAGDKEIGKTLTESDHLACACNLRNIACAGCTWYVSHVAAGSSAVKLTHQRVKDEHSTQRL